MEENKPKHAKQLVEYAKLRLASERLAEFPDRLIESEVCEYVVGLFSKANLRPISKTDSEVAACSAECLRETFAAVHPDAHELWEHCVGHGVCEALTNAFLQGTQISDRRVFTSALHVAARLAKCSIDAKMRFESLNIQRAMLNAHATSHSNDAHLLSLIKRFKKTQTHTLHIPLVQTQQQAEAAEAIAALLCAQEEAESAHGRTHSTKSARQRIPIKLPRSEQRRVMSYIVGRVNNDDDDDVAKRAKRQTARRLLQISFTATRRIASEAMSTWRFNTDFLRSTCKGTKKSSKSSPVTGAASNVASSDCPVLCGELIQLQPQTLSEAVYRVSDQIQEKGRSRKPEWDAIVERVSECGRALWSERFECDVYGSVAADLALPSSDVDISVLATSLPPNALSVLAEHLREQTWVVGTVLEIVHTAVPVIKLCTHQNVSVDISFRRDDERVHNGQATVQKIARLKEQLPTLSCLTIILKQLLYERGLSDPYRGGLASYALIVMVASFLENETKNDDDVGSQLKRFMLRFGTRVFRAATDVVRISQEDGHPSCYTQAVADIMPPLTVVDPVEPSNNIGRSCFRFAEIQSCFDQGYHALAAFDAGSLSWDSSSDLFSLFDAPSRSPHQIRGHRISVSSYLSTLAEDPSPSTGQRSFAHLLRCASIEQEGCEANYAARSVNAELDMYLSLDWTSCLLDADSVQALLRALPADRRLTRCITMSNDGMTFHRFDRHESGYWLCGDRSQARTDWGAICEQVRSTQQRPCLLIYAAA